MGRPRCPLDLQTGVACGTLQALSAAHRPACLEAVLKQALIAELRGPPRPNQPPLVASTRHRARPALGKKLVGGSASSTLCRAGRAAVPVQRAEPVTRPRKGSKGGRGCAPTHRQSKGVRLLQASQPSGGQPSRAARPVYAKSTAGIRPSPSGAVGSGPTWRHGHAPGRAHHKAGGAQAERPALFLLSSEPKLTVRPLPGRSALQRTMEATVRPRSLMSSMGLPGTTVL